MFDITLNKQNSGNTFGKEVEAGENRSDDDTIGLRPCVWVEIANIMYLKYHQVRGLIFLEYIPGVVHGSN